MSWKNYEWFYSATKKALSFLSVVCTGQLKVHLDVFNKWDKYLGTQFSRLQPQLRDVCRPLQRVRQRPQHPQGQGPAPSDQTEEEPVGALHPSSEAGLPHDDQGLRSVRRSRDGVRRSRRDDRAEALGRRRDDEPPDDGLHRRPRRWFQVGLFSYPSLFETHELLPK